MIYMRGQAADYDGWRQLGLTGWGWDDVKPLFLKHQDHMTPGEHHGEGGEWRVEHPRMRWAVLDAFAAAAEAAGIPQVPDFNTGDNTGVGYFQVNQKARPPLVGRQRLPQAGPQASEPQARNPRHGRACRDAERPRHRRRLVARRQAQDEPSTMSRAPTAA